MGTINSRLRVELRDPSSSEKGGRLVMTAYAAVVISADPSIDGAYDRLIASLTLDSEELAEMVLSADERPDDPEGTVSAEGIYYYCALCGHWLGFSECGGCNLIFPRDRQRRIAPSTPMPLKVIEFFTNAGHTFDRDPRYWLTAA